MNTTKMNKQIKNKKTITCSTCGKTGHSKNNEKFHPDYKFTGVSVPTPVYSGRKYTPEQYVKISDGRIQPLCFGCNVKTDTHKQQWVDYPEGGGFYTFCCDNTDCVQLQWNGVVEDGNNLYSVQKPVEDNLDDQDIIIIMRMMGVAPEPIPVVKIQPPIVEDAISDEEDDGFENCDCGYIHHYEDKCPNETTREHYERWKEEDNSEYMSEKYDAVIAEINAGVCSLDNAIRINKHQIKVHTYVNHNTQIKSSHLEFVHKYGSCPHQDHITCDSSKDPYIVGNIFGETKLRLTPDGEIIYDRTYFKGKDKQRYFATRWLNRPEYYYSGSGVEILGMRGKHLTKDGKYKYEGVSIAQLKDACKMNGVKGTSGKDKHELVKLLMKV